MTRTPKEQLAFFPSERKAERGSSEPGPARAKTGAGARAGAKAECPAKVRARAGAKARAAATQDRDRHLPHRPREAHNKAHPVHVTIRRVAGGPSFRAQRVCAAIRLVIAGAKRNGVCVLHYSVQDNHLHLMVEGCDSADLSNQMRTLFSRVAFAVNAVARRSGKLFRDRHHRHALKKPREVRHALVYILFNDREHRGVAPATATAPEPALDPCSSAWWFHAWSPWDHPPKELLLPTDDAPISKPRTWLANWGWHRGDSERLLRFSECPRLAA